MDPVLKRSFTGVEVTQPEHMTYVGTLITETEVLEVRWQEVHMLAHVVGTSVGRVTLRSNLLVQLGRSGTGSFGKPRICSGFGPIVLGGFPSRPSGPDPGCRDSCFSLPRPTV